MEVETFPSPAWFLLHDYSIFRYNLIPFLPSPGRGRARGASHQRAYEVPLHPQGPQALGQGCPTPGPSCLLLNLTPSHFLWSGVWFQLHLILFLILTSFLTSWISTLASPWSPAQVWGYSTQKTVSAGSILGHTFKEKLFPTTAGAADQAQPSPNQVPNIRC